MHDSVAVQNDYGRCSSNMVSASETCIRPWLIVPARARVAQKTLRILQWKHFVPEYDQWFDNVFAKAWGRKHDTRVLINHVPLEQIHTRAGAEIKARKGHDLIMFTSSPARYEKYAINHAEVHEEVWGKQGQVNSWATTQPTTRGRSDSSLSRTRTYPHDFITEELTGSKSASPSDQVITKVCLRAETDP